MRVELTDGNWADFRDDLDRVTNRERRSLMKAFDSVEGDVSRGMAVTDALLALLITNWSFDNLPLPMHNVDVLGDLLAPDYDLLEHAASPLQEKLFVKFEPDVDKASPS